MSHRKHLLIADDNPKDIELALAALEDTRIFQEITVTRDGVETLDYLFRRGEYTDREVGSPDLMFLDLKMPKVDGLQVLKTIKSDPYLKLIPIVMLTSSREPQDLTKCYALGANAYIVKPVSFQVFVQALTHAGNFWGLVNEAPPTSSS